MPGRSHSTDLTARLPACGSAVRGVRVRDLIAQLVGAGHQRHPELLQGAAWFKDGLGLGDA